MIGKKVFIYRNLTKKCWSIRCVKTRRVIGHAQELCMVACTFKVSEAGRQRVLKEKQKNVHAGVEGTLLVLNAIGPGETQPVKYNPYKAGHFTCQEKPVTDAIYVVFDKNGSCGAIFN